MSRAVTPEVDVVELPEAEERPAGSVGLRPGRFSDLNTVRGLYREAFELNFPMGEWRRIRGAATFRLRAAIEGKDGQALVVAEQDGEPVGYIWWQHSTEPDGVHGVRVRGIGVVPARRGQGIGTLLASTLQVPVREGARRVVAEVSPYNRPVVALLKKWGLAHIWSGYALDVGTEGGATGG